MKPILDIQPLILAALLSACTHPGQPVPDPTQPVPDPTQPVPDHTRIEAFPLDPPAWRSDSGSTPTSVRGILPATGLCDGAAQTDPESDAVHLEYLLTASHNSPGFSFDEGTVRWLFRPDWTTAEPGPGTEAILLELRTAEATPRGFRWRVDAAGSRLDWTEFEGADERLLTSGNIAWTRDRWVVLTATFGPSGASLYTNGIVTRATGAPSQPPALQAADSRAAVRLRIGSDHEGQRPARGAFDELELFNYRMSSLFIEAELKAGIWAETNANPPSLRLRWRTLPDLDLAIRRRTAGQGPWTVVATNLNSWTWTDTGVTSGRRYEYIVDRVERARSTAERYLPAALEAPAVHDPGRALILVDRTLAAGLQTQLEQLRDDLRAEGWQPIFRQAPRHVASPWSNNVPLIEEVRQLVAEEYARAPGSLRALYLIGHIPIPHSGGYRPDGHHTRPFPADGYYGDTVRGTNDWTDAQWFPASPDFRTGHGRIPNEIGDGMFDQRLYPSPVEVPVGRVDFANLPLLTESPPPGAPVVSEVDLIRRYLDKAHRFRRGILSFPDRMTFFHPPPPLRNPVAAVYLALRDGHAWWGGNPDFLENVDPFREGRTRGYLVASVASFGSPTSVGQTEDRRWRTHDLAYPDRESSVGFYWVEGSYLGDWNAAIRPVPNVFLRALLAPPNSGLAAIWSRSILGNVLLQSIGLGDTLGEVFWYKMSDCPIRDGVENLVGHMHISLLGDPTLRFLRIEPVTGLRSTRRGGRVDLSWNAAADRATAYYVYRLPEGDEGPLVRLTPNPVAAPNFTDTDPIPGRSRYWVRPVRLTVTGCGSFHNLGPGQSVLAP